MMLYFGLSVFAVYIVFKMLYLLIPFCRKNKRRGGLPVRKQCGFSILVPAYNEQDVILGCIKSLVRLRYTNYNVFVINDGSCDDTFEILNAHL